MWMKNKKTSCNLLVGLALFSGRTTLEKRINKCGIVKLKNMLDLFGANDKTFLYFATF